MKKQLQKFSLLHKIYSQAAAESAMIQHEAGISKSGYENRKYHQMIGPSRRSRRLARHSWQPPLSFIGSFVQDLS